MRPGCQSYSGGEVAPRLKPAWIRNQGLYRRRGDGTNPGNRHQSAHAFIALRFRNDGTFEQVDLFGQGIDLIDNRREGEACRCGYPWRGALMLAICSLSKVYPNGTHALEKLSLSVGEGEVVAVIGGSGCGKSTRLRLLSGPKSPGQGEIRLNDKRLATGAACCACAGDSDETGSASAR